MYHILNFISILFINTFFFLEKYDYVGRLLKPGESHSYYTDEEETPTNKLHLKSPKQCESEILNAEENAEDDSPDKTEENNETKDKEFVNNSNEDLLKSNEKLEIIKPLSNLVEPDDSHALEK